MNAPVANQMIIQMELINQNLYKNYTWLFKLHLFYKCERNVHR